MTDDMNHADTLAPVDPEALAKGMYARVLSQWTLDLLHAGAHNLLTPSPRKGEGMTGLPFNPWPSAGLPLASDCERMLRWHPRRKAA